MSSSGMVTVGVAVALSLAGCGSGGGGGGDDGSLPAARPDVVLLFVSGHAFGGEPAYLRLDAAPEVEADLEETGRSVETLHYVDGEAGAGDAGGYDDLVADLGALRDWTEDGTRVVVVAHSHGGVWAHAAVRAVRDVPVAALVDLDVSSFGWTLLHDAAAIGGDPRDEYDVGLVVVPSGLESVPSEQTGAYDLEDVVFDHVAAALEVRSGASPAGGEWFDEKWNCRTTGSTQGLWWHFADEGHSDVHAPGGPTLALVRSWLRERLDE